MGASDLGFGILGFGFMVYGLWFMVYGLWFMVAGLGLRASGCEVATSGEEDAQLRGYRIGDDRLHTVVQTRHKQESQVQILALALR